MHPPQPHYHRDIDTLRGLMKDTLAPPPAEPKTAMTTSVLVGSIGVVVGCLVGIVAVHNAHAAQPKAAAAAIVHVPAVTTTSAAPASTPAILPTAVTPATASSTGTVDVDGPAGDTVFEGEQLVGRVPLTFTASLGEHTFRIEDAATKKSALVKVVVTDATVASVRIDGPKRAHASHHRIVHVSHGSGVVHARSPVSRGASAADIAGAQADLDEARKINAL